ncbi:MAG: sugar transferase [Candidatus Azobacteroides sp.]|nr:sugar transferase [Candidatus Azobacteroides sp.]
MYKTFFKYFIDFSISLLGLICISPVFIFVTICSLTANSGSLFFFQSRPGKNAKIFKVIKFKTMSDKRDKNGNLLSDRERLTKVGKFIRKTSLDEIPQLINVLKGDMSLIGPRPLLPEYLSLYNREQLRRHEVRPGITGWAQINGRNSISWTKKFELDIYYVDNISFLLDAKIFFQTIKKILVREGINSSDDVTMPPFNGYN